MQQYTLRIIVISTILIPMFGFGKTKNEIKVQFIEHGKTEAFAQSVMPVDQLPETFEINTTLDIGENQWSVVSAFPQKKSEFAKTGKLQIYLAKIQTMNPHDILYSLATINDSLPSLIEADDLDNVLIIREDDWRQIEFLSTSLAPGISEEIRSIINIYENERKDVGFKSLHVRSKLPHAFQQRSISLEETKKLLLAKHNYRGLAFNTTKAVIEGGFAFTSSLGIDVWGHASPNGEIQSLCLSAITEQVDPELFKEVIGEFAQKHDLVFVDWVSTFKAS